MIKNILRNCLVVIICQTLAYAPLIRAGQLSLPSGDLIAPEITQEKYIDTVKTGADHQITVTVTDNVGVKQVTLYYRIIGTTEEYKRKSMDNIVNTDDYHATIKSDQINPPGVEYYVQAMDNAGNTLLHGYSFSPLSVKTTNGDAATVASGDTAAILASEEESSNTWLWIGLGVLAAGVVAVAAGGGGGDDGGTTSTETGTATLDVNAIDPTQ